MSTASAELAAALAIQDEVDQARRFLAAGTAILAYDHALTFSDEIQHIWNSKKSNSLVVWLFLINRYGAPLLMFTFVITTSGAFTIGPKFCQANIFGGSMLVALLAVVFRNLGLIALRVHSLYGRRPEMGWFLIASLCLTTGASIGLGIWNLLQVIRKMFLDVARWTSTYLPHHDTPFLANAVTIKDIRVCTAGSKFPDTYWTLWIPSCIQETLVFTLTARKLLQRKQMSMSSLRTLLIRDGFLYYCGLMTWRLAGIVIFIQGHPSVIFETVFCFVGFGSTLVSRLFLNLRNFGQQSHLNEFGDDAATDPRWTNRAGNGGRFEHISGGGRGNTREEFGMRDLLPTAADTSRGTWHDHQSSTEASASPTRTGMTNTQLSRAISANATGSRPGVHVYFTPQPPVPPAGPPRHGAGVHLQRTVLVFPRSSPRAGTKKQPAPRCHGRPEELCNCKLKLDRNSASFRPPRIQYAFRVHGGTKTIVASPEDAGYYGLKIYMIQLSIY
ncbi:hypothetical protein DL93DRAFT_2096467 [Clavulina sp. PMI_390]|nr:hypothetical protein DL93DRAFT_2096467 [Clavulina sp. PMI_390]